MKCRYCGQEVRTAGTQLISTYGQACKTSPTGKHVIISDGVCCVYCGHETRTVGNRLITTHGDRCRASPSGTHLLQ